MFWEGFNKQASAAYLKAIGAFKKKPSLGSALANKARKGGGYANQGVSNYAKETTLKGITRANEKAVKYIDR